MPLKTPFVKTVRGHYDGKVVVLSEAAPVDHEVSVVVEFPVPGSRMQDPKERKFHWQLAGTGAPDASEEMVRQRRAD